MDLNETKSHIDGLKSAIAEKNKKQAGLLKLQGLDDEILKGQKEIVTIDEKLVTTKNELAALRANKEASVSEILDQIRERIDKLLPHGKSVISLTDDGQIIIGWDTMPYGKSMFVRYEGLSGAQQKIFDQALSYARLAGRTGILIYEAAEVDKENLQLLLERLKNTGFQVIINTWYQPPVKGFSKILKYWNVIKL